MHQRVLTVELPGLSVHQSVLALELPGFSSTLLDAMAFVCLDVGCLDASTLCLDVGCLDALMPRCYIASHAVSSISLDACLDAHASMHASMLPL